jgi:thymidylate synthase ThyX
MQLLGFRVEGVDYAVLSFLVSNGKLYESYLREGVSLCLHCIYWRYRRKWGRELAKMLARYPQTMEFIEIWAIVADVPKYVVDHIVRHRIASFMVHSLRHGKPAMKIDPEIQAEIGVDLTALKEHVERLLKACNGRHELCTRLVPPILDHRMIMIHVNLRELAHIYCERKYRGGQKETVQLVELLIQELEKQCPLCVEAVHEYCTEYCYVKDTHANSNE